MLAGCGAASKVATPTGAVTGGATSRSTATPSAPAKRAPDACALITRQEASTAIGAAAGAPTKAVSGCSYTGPTGEAVGVLLLTPVDRAAFDAFRAKAHSDIGYRDVPGAGDSAFMGSGGGAGQFQCLKRSTAMTITLSLGRNGPVATPLMTLGKTACGRL